MTEHIVLCGLGKIGYSILERLHSLGEPVVVVTRGVSADWQRRVEKLAERLIIADARMDEVMLDAGLADCKAVIACTNDDVANLEIALDAQRLAPRAAIVVRLYDWELGERVSKDLNVRAVLNAAELAAPAFVAAALGERVLRTFPIGQSSVNIVSLPIEDEASGAGTTLREFAARYNVIPLALDRVHAGGRSAGRHPAEEFIPTALLGNETLTTGDILTVAVSQSSLHALRHDRPHLLEVDKIRRQSRRKRATAISLIREIWQNAAAPLRIAFIGLNALVLLSIFVFHFGWNLGWVNAFYFTLTIMTTVGFGDIHLINAPVWIKLYGCLLMVGGVALMLVFFSVITDFLVTQRFEQLLGKRKTTLEGHTIVVGLGNLGSRVAQRLHELGETLLAVEKNPASPFLGQVSQAVPVVTGDATQSAVLEQAGVERARAVLALTDDDRANLRINHLTMSANPGARTVVRLFQSALAQKLGTQMLGIAQPLNPAELVAATFVASALAPDVEHGFTLNGRLFMLRWLSASTLRARNDRTAGSLRDDEQILAIMRRPAHGEVIQELSRADEIRQGDQLLIIDEYHCTGAPSGDANQTSRQTDDSKS